MPIWVANFVLGEYGTGAVMGVPATTSATSSSRKAYRLPITVVVAPGAPPSGETMSERHREGTLVNSGRTGRGGDAARGRMTKAVERAASARAPWSTA